MTKTQESTEEEVAETESTTDTAAKNAEEQENKLRADLQSAELAKIKAEAERDAFIKAMELAKQGPQAQATVSDEQWNQLSEKTGMTKEAIMTNAQIAQQMVDAATKKMEEKLSAAEKKATDAEEKANRFEKSREQDKVRGDFYSSRPALTRHSKDVDEFVGMFPEEDRNDPKKLKDILNKAEIYIRGKVGDKMKKESGSSPAFERGTETDTTETSEIDIRSFKPNEARFIKSAGMAMSREKELSEYDSTRGRQGIEIPGGREWEKAHEDIAKLRK